MHRCEFAESTAHGDVAVIGYKNEQYLTMDVVTESSYVFLATAASDYPIGNFVKLAKSKLILSRGIKTKESSPIIWNLNQFSI